MELYRVKVYKDYFFEQYERSCLDKESIGSRIFEGLPALKKYLKENNYYYHKMVGDLVLVGHHHNDGDSKGTYYNYLLKIFKNGERIYNKKELKQLLKEGE